MRHRKHTVKLNRTSSHRKAMFRNMVTSLFKYDRIKTTDAKAKELRRWADHIITLAKKGDLHARRQVLSIVREKAVVHKLFDEVNDRFGSTSGGYTRILKIGLRPGDAAAISLIEFVTPEEEKKKKRAKKKPTSKPVLKTADKKDKAVSKKDAASSGKKTKKEKVSDKVPEAKADESSAKSAEADVVSEAQDTPDAEQNGSAKEAAQDATKE
jgi:large subunit ribosomal protein L17